MNNADRIATACKIASNLDDPQRQEDVHRYHKAIIDGLNEVHDENGEQDALAVMDAFAHSLAQSLANLDDRFTQLGYLEFVIRRAEWLLDAYKDSGVAARHRMVES